MASFDREAFSLSPLLVGLQDDELTALMEAAQEVRYQTGQVVVTEGTPGDTLFMLMEGAVTVEKAVPGKPAVELAVLKDQGNFFGEMVFVDVQPRSATIRARTDVVLLAFDLPALETFFGAHKDAHLSIMLNIARMLSQRLRRADLRIAQLSSGEA